MRPGASIAAAPISPLAQEFPYAVGVDLIKERKKKKKEKEIFAKNFQKVPRSKTSICCMKATTCNIYIILTNIYMVFTLY